jgi:hypothetical protein
MAYQVDVDPHLWAHLNNLNQGFNPPAFADDYHYQQHMQQHQMYEHFIPHPMQYAPPAQNPMLVDHVERPPPGLRRGLHPGPAPAQENRT